MSILFRPGAISFCFAMYLFEAQTADDDLLQAFQRLVPQLTANNPPPSREHLVALLDSGASTLLVARDPDEAGPIVGALCLAIYRVPTGTRAIIEDVIVDEHARARGIGEALMRRAIEVARDAGAQTLALTSNPRREVANRLYVRLGFDRRETNLYQLKLTQ